MATAGETARKWRLVVVEVPASTSEVCASLLVEKLGVGVVETARGSVTELSVYLDPGSSAPTEQTVCEPLRGLLAEIGGGTAPLLVRDEWIEEEDWANAWRQHARPIAVGRRISVMPSWHVAPADAERVVIRLDPGLAFGTGAHASTRVALELLEEFVTPGMVVADVGCGSGILSIAAALLGAERVAATDVDRLAVKATRENAERNAVGGRVSAAERSGPAPRDGAGFDLVVANITPLVIAGLLGEVAAVLKSGGVFVASGILSEYEDEVVGPAEASGALTLRRRLDCEGWCGLAFTRA